MSAEKDPGFGAPCIAWTDDISAQSAVAHQAGELIRHGGLIVYPTDTVYGLGTDPMNPLAIQRIYEAKARPPEKAIIWLIDKLDRVTPTCEIDEAAQRLAAVYLPGALTLVLRRRNPRTDLPTQAVRIPDHPIALAIIEAAGGAVATTSANRSGSPSARSAEEAADALGQHVDLIVDGGTTPGGLESTVLDVSTWPPTILRAGPISAADVQSIIGVAVEQRA